MRNLKRRFLCITLSALLWADPGLAPWMCLFSAGTALAHEAPQGVPAEDVEDETDLFFDEIYDAGEGRRELGEDASLELEYVPEDADSDEALLEAGAEEEERGIDGMNDPEELIEETDSPEHEASGDTPLIQDLEWEEEDAWGAEHTSEFGASWKQAAQVYERAGRQMAASAKAYPPKVGSMGGEWEILGLARSGQAVAKGIYESYLANVADTLAEKKGVLHTKKYTEYSRVVLALTSLGADVTNVAGYNLLSPLADFDQTVWQGVNGAIFALLAFDSHAYEIPAAPGGKAQTTREKLISHILSKEISGGGWAMSGSKADPDVTGMALQALAPYYEQDAAVAKAIDRGVAVLSAIQDTDGGYTTVGTATCESCAQVVVALSALGIDANTDKRFLKKGRSVLDALLTYANEDGTFRHIMTGDADVMATEQGYYALTAYERFQNGMNALYDMTDVEIVSSGYSGVQIVPAAEFDGTEADLTPRPQNGSGSGKTTQSTGSSGSKGGSPATGTGKGAKANTNAASSGSGSQSGSSGSGSTGTSASAVGGRRVASGTTKSVNLTSSGAGSGSASGSYTGGGSGANGGSTGSAGKTVSSGARSTEADTAAGTRTKAKAGNEGGQTAKESESETDRNPKQGTKRRSPDEETEQLTEGMPEDAPEDLQPVSEHFAADSAGYDSAKTGFAAASLTTGDGSGSGELPMLPLCAGMGAGALLLLMLLLKKKISLDETE